jgi:hypothetical protein
VRQAVRLPPELVLVLAALEREQISRWLRMRRKYMRGFLELHLFSRVLWGRTKYFSALEFDLFFALRIGGLSSALALKLRLARSTVWGSEDERRSGDRRSRGLTPMLPALLMEPV